MQLDPPRNSLPRYPAYVRQHVQLAGQRALSFKHLQRGVLLAVILIGFALRLFRLAFRELRGDESFGYFFSLPSLGEIVARTFGAARTSPRWKLLSAARLAPGCRDQ